MLTLTIPNPYQPLFLVTPSATSPPNLKAWGEGGRGQGKQGKQGKHGKKNTMPNAQCPIPSPQSPFSQN
ncbi:hypothetical protein CV014_05140 [Nostoc sp. CMAA1605]|nr:hypothetical protein [Nostoc sp. CMAA1605]